MKINCNYQNYSKPMAFRGKLIMMNEEENPDRINNAFYGNTTLQALANASEYDIIGKVKSRNADKYEVYKEGRDSVLYKFSMTSGKKPKGFIDKLANLFSKRPIIKPTRNYHSEETTSNIISRYNDLEALKKELNI